MEQPSILRWLASATQTRWWHDSGDPDELARGLEDGAVGVTTNPVLTAQALKAQPAYWKERIAPEVFEMKGDAKVERLMQVVALETAAKLLPQYRASQGADGYVCAQVSPAKAGDREAMLEMARRYHAWAPNIAVKLPVTLAGLDVLEECSAEGITVTATVSFTVPQALEIARRHRLGSLRARQAGIVPGRCFAVIMIGRLDDYLREVARDNAAEVSETDIRQAGLAATKRAYEVYMEEDYEAVLLVAALRGVHHFSGLAGGKLILSVHPSIQKLLHDPALPRRAGIADPIEPQALQRLQQMNEFVRAYEPQGMRPEEFVTYGVTQRTLAQFQEAGWQQLEGFK